MGYQRLNDRSLRRLNRELEQFPLLPVVRAIVHGGSHWIMCVTFDHQHLSVLRARHNGGQTCVELDRDARTMHFSSCEELFGKVSA